MSAAIAPRILDALRRIGCTVYLLEEGGAKSGFLASIQPAARLQNQDAGPLGTGRRNQAVLYASCGCVTRRLEPGKRIEGNGAVYRTLQTETIRLAGREAYIWAALERESAAGEDEG